MWGPCGPKETLAGAYSAIIRIPEGTVYLIVYITEPLHRIKKFSQFVIGMPTNR